MDEAHALKDYKTHANLAIQWLQAQKHAMASATLVPLNIMASSEHVAKVLMIGQDDRQAIVHP